MAEQAMEFAQDYANDEETSDGGSESTGGVGQGRQSDSDNDITKNPKFQKVQSEFDKRILFMENLLRQRDAEVGKLSQEVRSFRMEGMDDVQRLAYEKQELEYRLAEERRQRELDAFAIQRRRDLEEISSETGCPIEDLENAKDSYEAWKIGRAYEKAQIQAAKNSQANRQEGNPRVDDRVDVGGGKPSTAATRLQEKYDAARRNYNLKEMLQIDEEAYRQRLNIRKW